MIHILKPRNVNSESQKSNTLDLSLKKENWQWIPLNSKGYWIGLHQKQLKYNPSYDLETFTIVLSKDSPIWHILFMIYSRSKTIPMFGHFAKIDL
jgi:hypothetical protein